MLHITLCATTVTAINLLCLLLEMKFSHTVSQYLPTVYSVKGEKTETRCSGLTCKAHSRNWRASISCHKGNCTYERNIEARSRNRCCRGKTVRITYSECVSVALVIQHARPKRLIVLSSVACLVSPYYSTLFHKRHDFREKNCWM
jgi:hypothetical protein